MKSITPGLRGLLFMLSAALPGWAMPSTASAVGVAGPDQSETRSLVAHLRAHDGAIRSLEFELAQYQFPQTPVLDPHGQPVADPQQPVGWPWMLRGQYGISGERYYLRALRHTGDGGHRVVYASDAGLTRWLPQGDPRLPGSVVGSTWDHFRIFSSPPAFLLRWFDTSGQRTVADECARALRAGQIQALPADRDGPGLVYQGAALGRYHVSLWLDPDRDLVLRRVVFWDTARRVPIRDYRAVGYERVDEAGAWVPTLIVFAAYSVRDAGEVNMQAVVERARSMAASAALPVELGGPAATVREAVLDLLAYGEVPAVEESAPVNSASGPPRDRRRVWGPMGDFGETGVLHTPQIAHARILTVNRGLTDWDRTFRWDADHPVSDTFARVRTTFGAEPGQWTLADAPLGEPPRPSTPPVAGSSLAGGATATADPLPAVAPPSDPPALPRVREVHPPDRPGVVVGQLDLLAIARADPENLGSRRAGSTVTRTVVFGNPTPHVVRVAVTGSTCGCTSAGFTRTELAPGQSTELTVSAVVPASPGPQRQFVSFTVERDRDARDEPEGAPGLPVRQSAMVGLAYSSDWSVTVMPTQVLRIVRVGQEVRNVISFYSGPPGFYYPLDRMTCTIPQLTVSGPKRFITEPPGEDADYTRAVVLSGVFDAPGLYEGVLRGPDEGADRTPVEIPLSIKVEPGWTATPHAWTARRVPAAGERFSLALRRENNAVPSVVAVRLEPADAPARADLTIRPDGVASVEVTFGDDAAARRADGFDVELLDERGRVQLSIPVGWWTPPPTPDAVQTGSTSVPPASPPPPR
jgi:hypothetical protein